jgi:hypothetical protein
VRSGGGMWGPAWRSGGACVVGSGARGLRACGGLLTEAKTGAARDCQVGPQHSNRHQDLNSKKKKSNSI